MATTAIDFGTYRSRLALVDRRTRRPCVAATLPAVAYAPRVGKASFGEAAERSIAEDPAGGIDGLRLRLGGDVAFRNGRIWEPSELAASLFEELRRAAFERPDLADPLSECIVLAPTRGDLRDREALAFAARRAGFDRVEVLDEAVAAVRCVERTGSLAGSVAVVCDLGSEARVATLRRRGDDWRPDYTMLPPPVSFEEEESPLLFDVLRSAAKESAKEGRLRPPLIVVGGGAGRPFLADRLRREGWPGEVLVAEEAEHAAVLGALALGLKGEADAAEPARSVRGRSRPNLREDAKLTSEGGSDWPIDLWRILEDREPASRRVATPETQVDWIDHDGTLRMSDYARGDLENVMAVCRRRILDGGVRRLHLLGEEWTDEDVVRLREGLAPHASDDDWVARDPSSRLSIARSAHPSLEELQLSSCGALTSEALFDLSHLATLAVVDLSGWEARDSALDAIRLFSRLPQLRLLRLPRPPYRAGRGDENPRREALLRFFRERRPEVDVI